MPDSPDYPGVRPGPSLVRPDYPRLVDPAGEATSEYSPNWEYFLSRQ